MTAVLRPFALGVFATAALITSAAAADRYVCQLQAMVFTGKVWTGDPVVTKMEFRSDGGNKWKVFWFDDSKYVGGGKITEFDGAGYRQNDGYTKDGLIVQFKNKYGRAYSAALDAKGAAVLSSVTVLQDGPDVEVFQGRCAMSQ